MTDVIQPTRGLLWIAMMPLLMAAGLSQAQDQANQPRYSQAAGRAGVGSYKPGNWGIVSTDVINPSKDEIEVLAALSFEQDSGLQFGRRIWIPPRAKRSTWHPVRAPEEGPTQGTAWRTRSMLFDAAGSRETPIAGPDGRIHLESLLGVQEPGPLTALLSDEGDENVLAAVTAMRMDRNLSKRVFPLEADALLPTVEGLDALDQLVISNDRLLAEPTACTAIRQWLHLGGHLWILLDKVDPDTVSAILGNAFDGTIVDRVSLTDVQIEQIDSPRNVPEQRSRHFEQPVDLVRVIAGDLRVTHAVNGWPAAMWKDVGRGKILLTTLAPRGWLRPRTHEDILMRDPEGSVAWLAEEPFGELAFQFFGSPRPRPLSPADLEDFVSSQIGYEIIGRRWVAGVLGTFCFALCGSGLLLNRQRRLEHMGWIGPLLAIGAALMLALLGQASRQAVPSTIGVGQFVESVAGGDEVQISGLLVLYNQQAESGNLGSHQGGMFWPDLEGQEGTIRRIVWTDRSAWHWENVTLPPGLRRAPFRQSWKPETPLVVRATFGPDGLIGSYQSGPFTAIADPLIAMPTRRHLAARLGDPGRFTAGINDVLVEGQFISGNLLSTQQQRRRGVYERLLSQPAESRYPNEPMFLAWAEPLNVGFDLPSESNRIGEALLAIPLRFDPPEPGTSVMISAPFIGYRTIGRDTSATYDNERGQWLGPFGENQQTLLRFQPPVELLPLQVDRAVLTIDINAPSRDVEIVAYDDGTPVSLATRRSPLGRLRFEIDRRELLQLDADGGLLVGINVQTPSGASSALVWKIDDVQLEIQGQTLAP